MGGDGEPVKEEKGEADNPRRKFSEEALVRKEAISNFEEDIQGGKENQPPEISSSSSHQEG